MGKNHRRHTEEHAPEDGARRNDEQHAEDERDACRARRDAQSPLARTALWARRIVRQAVQVVPARRAHCALDRVLIQHAQGVEPGGAKVFMYCNTCPANPQSPRPTPTTPHQMPANA